MFFLRIHQLLVLRVEVLSQAPDLLIRHLLSVVKAPVFISDLPSELVLRLQLFLHSQLLLLLLVLIRMSVLTLPLTSNLRAALF